MFSVILLASEVGEVLLYFTRNQRCAVGDILRFNRCFCHSTSRVAQFWTSMIDQPKRMSDPCSLQETATLALGSDRHGTSIAVESAALNR